jgi:molybdenum cofactor cytidylyltransferase
MAAAYQKGLSASLSDGIAALSPGTEAALICLGDMPLVTAALMNRLMAAYTSSTQHPIVVPVWQGRQGNPVLWDRRFFAEICALTGDAGARTLLQRHGADAIYVNAESDAVLVDFDTPDSLEAARHPEAAA